MDNKIRALIAIGASVTAHCQPCLAFHVEKARELGVVETDIQEALAMALKVEEGASGKMRDFISGIRPRPNP